MPNYCVSCGADLPGEARFCPECGEPVAGKPDREPRRERGTEEGAARAGTAGQRRGRRPKVEQTGGWLGPYRSWVVGAVVVTGVILVFIGTQDRPGRRTGTLSPAFDQAESVDFRQQIQQAQRILLEDPNNLQAIITLANVYFDAGSHAVDQGDQTGGRTFLEQAVAYYLRALEQTPESPELRTDLGTAYNRLDRKQEAIAQFTKVLEYRPGFVTAMFNLGVVHEQIGDRERAREWYRRAAEADPAGALGRSARERLEALPGGN